MTTFTSSIAVERTLQKSEQQVLVDLAHRASRDEAEPATPEAPSTQDVLTVEAHQRILNKALEQHTHALTAKFNAHISSQLRSLEAMHSSHFLSKRKEIDPFLRLYRKHQGMFYDHNKELHEMAKQSKELQAQRHEQLRTNQAQRHHFESLLASIKADIAKRKAQIARTLNIVSHEEQHKVQLEELLFEKLSQNKALKKQIRSVESQLKKKQEEAEAELERAKSVADRKEREAKELRERIDAKRREFRKQLDKQQGYIAEMQQSMLRMQQDTKAMSRSKSDYKHERLKHNRARQLLVSDADKLRASLAFEARKLAQKQRKEVKETMQLMSRAAVLLRRAKETLALVLKCPRCNQPLDRPLLLWNPLRRTTKLPQCVCSRCVQKGVGLPDDIVRRVVKRWHSYQRAFNMLHFLYKHAQEVIHRYSGSNAMTLTADNVNDEVYNVRHQIWAAQTAFDRHDGAQHNVPT